LSLGDGSSQFSATLEEHNAASAALHPGPLKSRPHLPSSPPHMQTAGLFISFEGIDGAGNHLLSLVLADVFHGLANASLTCTRANSAEKLREMVLNDAGSFVRSLF
jgi:hypothetical protein